MPKRPSKKTVKQFAWYNVGGIAFFVIGYLIFTLLYGVLSWNWFIAKVIADLVGATVNYLVQRFIAFREESQSHSERKLLFHFSILGTINVIIDYAIVGGLKWLGVTPFIGMFVAASFFTIWKFVWYKLWVFKSHSQGKV